MAKKNSDSGEIFESGKWSASKDYTESMVMEILNDCKNYEEIAEFGSANIYEEYINNFINKEELRINAIKRLIFKLRQLITNTYFALEPKDQKSIKDYKIKIDYIKEKIVPQITTKKIRYENKNEEINKDKFNFALLTLQQIRETYSQMLNDADLIYFKKEPEMTKQEYDKLIWDEATKQG